MAWAGQQVRSRVVGDRATLVGADRGIGKDTRSSAEQDRWRTIGRREVHGRANRKGSDSRNRRARLGRCNARAELGTRDRRRDSRDADANQSHKVTTLGQVADDRTIALAFCRIANQKEECGPENHVGGVAAQEVWLNAPCG